MEFLFFRRIEEERRSDLACQHQVIAQEGLFNRCDRIAPRLVEHLDHRVEVKQDIFVQLLPRLFVLLLEDEVFDLLLPFVDIVDLRHPVDVGDKEVVLFHKEVGNPDLTDPHFEAFVVMLKVDRVEIPVPCPHQGMAFVFA